MPADHEARSQVKVNEKREKQLQKEDGKPQNLKRGDASAQCKKEASGKKNLFSSTRKKPFSRAGTLLEKKPFSSTRKKTLHCTTLKPPEKTYGVGWFVGWFFDWWIGCGLVVGLLCVVVCCSVLVVCCSVLFCVFFHLFCCFFLISAQCLFLLCFDVLIITFFQFFRRTPRPPDPPPPDRPKFRAFFPLLPPFSLFFFFSLLGSSRGILVVFEAPSNVHVWSSRAVV